MKARSDPKASRVNRLRQELRSLFHKQYRRAFRNLRHLPQLTYRSVIDGGANRGAFTDAFLQLHQPERLVMVEAIPDLAEKLRAKCAMDRRVSVVSAALSDTEGEAQFEINRSEASSSLLAIDPRNSKWFSRDLKVDRAIRVRTMTLPALMEEQALHGGFTEARSSRRGASRLNRWRTGARSRARYLH